MVSLRQLENTAEIRLVKRDEIPWEQIRQDLFFWLIGRDIESGEAEELVDAAIVRVFSSMPSPDHVANPGRIKLDVRMTIGSIRQEQAIERGWFASDITDDWEDEASSDCHSKRLSRLSPQKVTTSVNDAIRVRRETERLFASFSREYWKLSIPDTSETDDRCCWYVMGGVPHIEPASDTVWCFIFDDSFHASLPTIPDTWQPIPVRYEYSCRSYGTYAIAYRTAVD